MCDSFRPWPQTCRGALRTNAISKAPEVMTNAILTNPLLRHQKRPFTRDAGGNGYVKKLFMLSRGESPTM